ncbi:MAG TPA: twin-arginine translocase subunit TatC [Saprospiraceae bacterium]|mgnify:CR=1 FL=1|nr:twin-arginine translocase subunit TatC [Saprospiraceae bacterium]HPN69846.1 twin-arginine translocase subunit TatC [Saprospiraceae bacterium]
MSIISVLTKKKSSSSGAPEEKEMGFFDHLEVLRWHIIRSVAMILVLAIVFFMAKSFTFDTVVFGPKKADFITYKFICDISPAVCFSPPELKLITREMGEQFFIHMKVAFWLGLIVSFPYIFWEFWRFIKPGLYKEEQKAVGGIVFYCSFLFFLGIAFGYYVIAPFSITWLGTYSVGTETENSPTLASYVNYMTMFTIPTGIIFELPIVAFFLGKIGILTSSFMSVYRKHAIIVIFIVAAVVTPPDVMTQILIGTPVWLLYEMSIFIVKAQERKNRAVVPVSED